LDKIVPVLAEKIGEALTPIIEDETKKYIETHVAPLKEAIDNTFGGRPFTCISCIYGRLRL
jgi:hypothetical protein